MNFIGHPHRRSIFVGSVVLPRCLFLFLSDSTYVFQHALRLQAFRQLHKVLAVEPLKPNPIARMLGPAKRRAEENGNGDAAGSKVAKKE